MIVPLPPVDSPQKVGHFPRMSITLAVEKDSIKLPIGVHLPDGTKVEVILPGEAVTKEDGATLYERMKDFVGCLKDGPADLAAEHDHYAHGTPKRSRL
jgi:hypothetical protein